MQQESNREQEIIEGDIIFECPHCSKSLAIDPRGAGLMIICPDCGAEIPVPEESLGDELESTAEVFVARAVHETEATSPREDDVARFEAIGRELGIIQDAVDRIVATIQDVTGGDEPED